MRRLEPIAAVVGLVVFAAATTGCSDEAKITDKTEWLCEYEQFEEPTPDHMPEEIDLGEYLHADVLDYLEDDEDDAFGEDFAAEFAEAMEPMVRGSMAAATDYTDCTVDDVEVEEDWARVEFTREIPEPDVGLGGLDEFDEDADQEDFEEQFREWYAEADTVTKKEHELAFRNTDDGWRAYPALEREELQQDLEEAEERLEEVREEIAENEDARRHLADFEIHSAELRTYNPGRFRDERVAIDLEVENNTDHAISRVYFEGEYISPDREVPWEEGSLNYEVSGGVEPGESVEWNLEPNRMSDWYGTEVRDDAELHAEVVGLDGPDGDSLWELPTDSDFEFGGVMDDDEDFDSLEDEKDHLQQQVEQLRADLEDKTPEILR